MQLAFVKCHGSGNDFPLIDARSLSLSDPEWAGVARALSDRAGPVGGDGILLLTQVVNGDFGMRMMNPDGSEAETCLNGLRCVARAGFEALGVDSAHVQLKTSTAQVAREPELAPGVVTIRTTVGPASTRPADVGLKIDAGECIDAAIPGLPSPRAFTAVAMPNPHLVTFVEAVDEAELVALGDWCEAGPALIPARANVSFVEQRGPDALFVRTYERGVGLTDSCGSAMAASVLAAALTGRVPFDADSDYDIMRMQAEVPLPRASETRADLPPSVDDLLQKLCAKKREERLQTCEDVLREVARIEAEISAGPTPAQAVTAAPSPTAAPAPASARPSAHEPPAPSKDVTTPPIASTRPGDASAPAPASPGEAPRRTGLWVAAGLVLAAAGGAAVLVVTGVLPPPAKWLAPARPSASSTAAAVPSAEPAPSASTAQPPASAAVPPFESLVGTWIGDSDRALEAVKVAGAIEFRVKDPAQFAPADYEAGETRFVLRRLPPSGSSSAEAAVFAVEDRLRPKPPLDFPFAPVARATCQEVRSEASGAPLRATLEGARLSVELMKIEPTRGNFLLDKGKTVSCVGLGKLEASKVVSVLVKK